MGRMFRSRKSDEPEPLAPVPASPAPVPVDAPSAGVFLGTLRSEVDEPEAVAESFERVAVVAESVLGAWRRRALSAEETAARLQTLRLRAADETEWTLGATTMRWYRRLPGGSWKVALPPARDDAHLSASADRAIEALAALGAGAGHPSPSGPPPAASVAAGVAEQAEDDLLEPFAPTLPATPIVPAQVAAPAVTIDLTPPGAATAEPATVVPGTLEAAADEAAPEPSAAPTSTVTPEPDADVRAPEPPAAQEADVDLLPAPVQVRSEPLPAAAVPAPPAFTPAAAPVFGYGDDESDDTGYGDVPLEPADTPAFPPPPPVPAFEPAPTEALPAPGPAAPAGESAMSEEERARNEELRRMLASLAADNGITLTGINDDQD